MVISRDVTFNESYIPFLTKKVAEDSGVQGKLLIDDEEKEHGNAQQVLDDLPEDVESQPTNTHHEEDLTHHEVEADSQIPEVQKSAGQRRRRTQVELLLEAQSRIGPEYVIPKEKERKIAKKIERIRFNNLLEFAFAILEFQNPDELASYKEAMECKDSIHWKRAMEEEMKSLHKNKTWVLVDKQLEYKVVKCKVAVQAKNCCQDWR